MGATGWGAQRAEGAAVGVVPGCCRAPALCHPQRLSRSPGLGLRVRWQSQWVSEGSQWLSRYAVSDVAVDVCMVLEGVHPRLDS